MSKNNANKFSPEVRERAVRLVQESRSEYPSLWVAVECHASAYIGQLRVGIFRPVESSDSAGWSRHISARAESAYSGHGAVGIYRPTESRHISAT